MYLNGCARRQRVAGDVGHPVEDLRRLVAVRHDHRAALALELLDGVDPGQVQRHLQARHQLFKAGTQRGMALGDLGGPSRTESVLAGHRRVRIGRGGAARELSTARGVRRGRGRRRGPRRRGGHRG